MGAWSKRSLDPAEPEQNLNRTAAAVKQGKLRPLVEDPGVDQLTDLCMHKLRGSSQTVNRSLSGPARPVLCGGPSLEDPPLPGRKPREPPDDVIPRLLTRPESKGAALFGPEPPRSLQGSEAVQTGACVPQQVRPEPSGRRVHNTPGASQCPNREVPLRRTWFHKGSDPRTRLKGSSISSDGDMRRTSFRSLFLDRVLDEVLLGLVLDEVLQAGFGSECGSSGTGLGASAGLRFCPQTDAGDPGVLLGLGPQEV
ncbi:hypothetical protein FQA47_011089 [Oryzias melastigma]|uniref:Uncharacterized protein n=1 Tax=Oryzias melastigma TaxID=30732 RepID=A0A834CAX6_ORYME|nr:hypothetical protein FQA47_011089 [Oryzias melastigma]